MSLRERVIWRYGLKTSLARCRFCICVQMEWSQAGATSHFFLTRSKQCSAQHLATYLFTGMFAGVRRCSDARAQHIWALTQCQDRRLFHFNPNLKKHLPISIRWLLSETECCKRCGCTAPGGLPPRRMPGPEEFTGSVWTGENPPDWRLDRVAQRSSASTWCGHGSCWGERGGEVAETRLVHHTLCCACVPRTRVNTQDTIQITRACSHEFTRTQVFAHRFPL